MCRPFFDALKSGSRWKTSTWVFGGNSVCKDLAEHLDSTVFDAYIWIDRGRFINSLGYRFQILKQIRMAGFEVIIYPSHTRQYWLESVVRVCGAAERITSESVGSYMSSWETSLTSTRYTKIVSTGTEPQFEFYRNRSFFSTLASSTSLVNNLLISSLKIDVLDELPHGDFVLFAPGASTRNREWPLENFIEVARFLSQKMGLELVVIGSNREIPLGETIQQSLSPIPIKNRTGQLTLYQSLQWMKAAKLLISNESAPVHMAASTGTPTICISQGNHFSRWNPYPESVAPNILTVYPSAFGDVQQNYEKLSRQFHDQSDWSISDITPKQVISAAEKLLA